MKAAQVVLFQHLPGFKIASQVKLTGDNKNGPKNTKVNGFLDDTVTVISISLDLSQKPASYTARPQLMSDLAFVLLVGVTS